MLKTKATLFAERNPMSSLLPEVQATLRDPVKAKGIAFLLSRVDDINKTDAFRILDTIDKILRKEDTPSFSPKRFDHMTLKLQ